MALPLDTCLELNIDIQALLDLSIDLPGGVKLQAQIEPGQLPNLSVVVGSLLKQANVALTPLMPIFRIIDVCIAIVEFSKAIPDSLGPPPDPTNLIKKLNKLIAAANKLLSLIPPLSIPIMLVGMCKALAATLLAIITELEHLLRVQLDIDLRREYAEFLAKDADLLAGAAALSTALDCAQANFDLQLSLTTSGLGPLNTIIDLINLFCELAHLPKLASIKAGGNADALLEPLRLAVLVLQHFCESLPTSFQIPLLAVHAPPHTEDAEGPGADDDSGPFPFNQ